MTVQELKEEILIIIDEYIDRAEKFKKSYFAFVRHITGSYNNLQQANKLRAICNKNSAQEIFISEIYDICKTIYCSNNLLPEITLKIVNSELFSNAHDKYEQIEQRIEYANAHNDGGASDYFTTEDYISVLEEAKGKLNSIEMCAL